MRNHRRWLHVKYYIELFSKLFQFYFACNHVRNWNKIISAAEGVLELFRNYFRDNEHVGKYLCVAISLWNNFEIISGKFPWCIEIKLFQMDVGWNNFDIILFHM